jgi:hypothetical protein
MYICIVKPKQQNNMENLNGLSERHVAQIVRRKMIQKVKPSAKVYNRKNNKKHHD